MTPLLDLVAASNDAMTKRDASAMGALYADDIEFANPTSSGRGRDAVVANLSALLAAVHDVQIETTWTVEAGDSVAVEYNFAATFTDVGKRLDIPTAAFYRFRNNEFVVIHEYYDLGAVESQLAEGAA